MNPAEIAAMTEFAPVKRSERAANVEAKPIRKSQRALIANGEASASVDHKERAPLVSKPKVSRKASGSSPTMTITPLADLHLPRAAKPRPQPINYAPHEEFPTYDPTPNQDIIDKIVSLHRLRQGMIKAQTKLKLQAMAAIRFAVREDGDYDSDESKAKARKKADALYRAVEADPDHELHGNVMPYLLALQPLDAQRALYEKQMVKSARLLPVYGWTQSVKGFGDVSFATIVGECGDIGTYKSVAAVWKRLGLAVFNGKRQGNPGDGATAADWIVHGYNKQRRSVSWNMRNNLIGGMGKFRPAFGDDVWANPELTYLQRVFVDRARYESEKLGLPVTESEKGKESYKKHPTNRAMRYTEKRMLRELYKAWRR